MIRRNRLSESVAFALTAVVAVPVNAAVLEEVTVTARKREESLQDAPLSISAISEQTINNAFLGDTRGITAFAPNLVFDEIPTGTTGGGGISIRGISFQDVEKSFDPVVIINVDGVPQGTNTTNVMNLLDVETIEVLRGPQGTLFGRNAVGGAINIKRKKPFTDRWAGKVRVRYENAENDGAPSVEGVVNAPIADNLAAKFNFGYIETPGFYENINSGQDLGESEDIRFGAHILWEATPDFTAEFQYNRSDLEGLSVPTFGTSGPNTLFCSAFGVCRQSETVPFSGDPQKAAGTGNYDFEVDSRSYQVNLNWDVSDSLTAVLIAARQTLEEEQFLDSDDSPLEIFEIRRANEYTQHSVEMRFDYDAGGRIQATTGFFFWDTSLDDWVNDAKGLALCGPGTSFAAPCQRETAEYGARAYSVFGEGDIRIAEDLYLIAGLRYINETKEISKTVDNPLVPGAIPTGPSFSGERTDSDVIYRFGARYEMTDDLMFYGTLSTGFRSGGFSIRAATEPGLLPGYAPEKLTNLEAGFKGTFLDQRLRLAATVFRMDYNDIQQELQVSRPPVGTQSTVVNAAEATFKGVELEGSALLHDFFTLDFNVGYLDASYDEFVGTVLEDQPPTTDNSNLELRRAPEWTYTIAGSYAQPVGPGELRGRISYNYRSEYWGSVSNFEGTQNDGFGLLDLSVGYDWQQWSLSFFGRNLTDVDVYSHNFAVAPNANPSPALGGNRALWTFASPRPPRTFGFELTYNFGDY